MSKIPTTTLVAHTGWNLAGLVLPVVGALVAIPILLSALGAERFGVLTLLWLFVGYFNLFDLGLGRALTQLLAKELGVGNTGSIPGLISGCLVTLSGLGLLYGSGIALAGPWFVRELLAISPEIQLEAIGGFYIISVVLPFTAATAGLRGILQAYRDFRVIALIRGPTGLFMFLAPLAVLPLSHDLFAISASLALVRLGSCCAYGLVCWGSGYFGGVQFTGVRIPQIVKVLKLAGWMSVSNLLYPFLVYSDRFIIGALISTAAITYYSVPYELVTKIWLVPGAIIAVLFPLFATGTGRVTESLTAEFARGVRYVSLIVFPIALLGISFAGEILHIWIGDVIPTDSVSVLRILVVGVYVNSIAQVAFALVQGAGRADISAKIHLLEIVPYLGCVVLGVTSYGLLGAASAWVARASLDALLMFGAAHRLLGSRVLQKRNMVVWALVIGAAFFVAALPELFSTKTLVVGVLLASFFAVAWKFAVSREERHQLMALFVKGANRER